MRRCLHEDIILIWSIPYYKIYTSYHNEIMFASKTQEFTETIVIPH